MHTLFLPDAPAAAAAFRVEGDEARHAVRVKRLGTGDRVRVLNGRGAMFICSITATGRALDLIVEESHTLARVAPRLDICSATPKGPRLDKMIDALSQVGAASWAPLGTDLGVVDPGEHKLERTLRIAAESAKQCARAWTLEIAEHIDFASALQGDDIVIACADALPYQPAGREAIRLLVGPEGGFTSREIDRARAAGARTASFGPHIMRIETAAVVAAGIILNAERPHHPAYALAFDTGNTDGD